MLASAAGVRARRRGSLEQLRAERARILAILCGDAPTPAPQRQAPQRRTSSSSRKARRRKVRADEPGALRRDIAAMKQRNAAADAARARSSSPRGGPTESPR